MKYLFTVLLLANAIFAFAQEDTVLPQEVKVEEVKLTSGDVHLQPPTGVAIATHGLPGEGQQPGLVCRFPSSAGEQRPLYVIDGIPSNLDGLNALNPNDIVSIDILKDASETLNLCNRSNNGVIIIKTKNSLTKRELRKQKRLERKAAKKLTKA